MSDTTISCVCGARLGVPLNPSQLGRCPRCWRSVEADDTASSNPIWLITTCSVIVVAGFLVFAALIVRDLAAADRPSLAELSATGHGDFGQETPDDGGQRVNVEIPTSTVAPHDDTLSDLAAQSEGTDHSDPAEGQPATNSGTFAHAPPPAPAPETFGLGRITWSVADSLSNFNAFEGSIRPRSNNTFLVVHVRTKAGRVRRTDFRVIVPQGTPILPSGGSTSPGQFSRGWVGAEYPRDGAIQSAFFEVPKGAQIVGAYRLQFKNYPAVTLSASNQSPNPDHGPTTPHPGGAPFTGQPRLPLGLVARADWKSSISGRGVLGGTWTATPTPGNAFLVLTVISPRGLRNVRFSAREYSAATQNGRRYSCRGAYNSAGIVASIGSITTRGPSKQQLIFELPRTGSPVTIVFGNRRVGTVRAG